MASPTAASTPAKTRLKTSRIPVRQHTSQQEINHSTHKTTQPFTDNSRSIHSVSVGNSSPRVLSSVGGASSEHGTSWHHPTGVALTQQHPTGVTTPQQHYTTGVTLAQQHHPTVVLRAQQHHTTGVMRTQQHDPNRVMTTQQYHITGVTMAQQHHPAVIMTTQHDPTGVMTTQQHHPTRVMTAQQQQHPIGVMTAQQHHPNGVMATQANSVGHINLGPDVIPAENSFDVNLGNESTYTHTTPYHYMILHTW